MAFPTIQGTAGTLVNTGNTTTHDVPYPTVSGGILADDILIIIVGTDAATSLISHSFPAGWNELDDQAPNALTVAGAVAWTRAAGGETGTVTVTTDVAERSSAAMICVRGAHTTSAPEISTVATAGSGAADPASLSPSWGAEDTKWLAIEVNDQSTIATAAPTNYSNLTNVNGTSAGFVAFADRDLNAASEDPGAFTMGSNEWVAWTLAIRPAGVAGPTPQTVAVGQATETDTAQSITPVPGAVTVQVGQATETDTAQAVTVVAETTVAVGQATETDTAQPVTVVPGAVTVLVGQAVETDTAQPVTPFQGSAPPQTISVGQAVETDTAQAVTVVTGAVTVAVGQAVETDTALSVTVVNGEAPVTRTRTLLGVGT